MLTRFAGRKANYFLVPNTRKKQKNMWFFLCNISEEEPLSFPMGATTLGVAEAPLLPEEDVTSIICSRSHCTIALSGGVDLSQSSSVAMMFFAT